MGDDGVDGIVARNHAVSDRVLEVVIIFDHAQNTRSVRQEWFDVASYRNYQLRLTQGIGIGK